MRAVISDTSPIRALLLLGEIGVLPRIFGEVLVPHSVLEELRHPKAPSIVRLWALQPPDWVIEASPNHLLLGLDLDRGETEAVSLAVEHHDSLLIIDEVKGRQVAASHGILITGTVGILEQAACEGLIDFEEAAQKLRATNFRISKTLLESAAERVRRRRSQ
ncbi:MAG: DUF3368 domain-containing protein [Verrucomicrobiaceae bacterium]|nr:MAG: DUF3368 domain-containing protein [Verrucomicrobiaceae bacterium]